MKRRHRKRRKQEPAITMDPNVDEIPDLDESSAPHTHCHSRNTVIAPVSQGHTWCTHGGWRYGGYCRQVPPITSEEHADTAYVLSFSGEWHQEYAQGPHPCLAWRMQPKKEPQQ
mmetsp:Transcript_29028/g.54537  ORF Transcript_29028/g.54537 Transcript_29028/m.54537 type:complete len:114 (+) Transcript_29028:45-386(+)